MVHPLHGFSEVTFSELKERLPEWSDVTDFSDPIGTPSLNCAACGKPWTPARRPRKKIKVVSSGMRVPVIFAYRICGPCARLYRRGGDQRASVLVALEQFINGPSEELA